jgi:hypothetical protein
MRIRKRLKVVMDAFMISTGADAPHSTVAEEQRYIATLSPLLLDSITNHLSSTCQSHLSLTLVIYNSAALPKVLRTLIAIANRNATFSAGSHTLSHPSDLSVSKSHVHYHHAIAMERKRIPVAIRAVLGCVRSQGLVLKPLTNFHGMKIVCKAISGYPLESHRLQVVYDFAHNFIK